MEQDDLEERTIVVNRSTKVVKGGKNFSFSALIVVGDKKGRVGMGFGKANELSDAIRKGGEQARRHMMTVPTLGSTITHAVEARFCAARVLVKPASQGTGVIAGGGMRAVLELAGIQDVLAKSLGSSNQSNVVKATFDALKKLRTKAEVMEKRDLKAL
ncbi:MAG: 30S ribosomal protein S5 [Oligosphaeraceae bacterium]